MIKIIPTPEEVNLISMLFNNMRFEMSARLVNNPENAVFTFKVFHEDKTFRFAYMVMNKTVYELGWRNDSEEMSPGEFVALGIYPDAAMDKLNVAEPEFFSSYCDIIVSEWKKQVEDLKVDFKVAMRSHYLVENREFVAGPMAEAC